MCTSVYGDFDETVDEAGCHNWQGLCHSAQHREQKFSLYKRQNSLMDVGDYEEEEEEEYGDAVSTRGNEQLLLPSMKQGSNSFEILLAQEDPTTQVMTYGMMEGLQPHLPLVKQGESFWLQYSLVRDGASIETLIDKCQLGTVSEYSVLAIETTDGEVFGAFVGAAWKLSTEFYGSGESFLWKRCSSRGMDIYKFAHRNLNIQLCQSHRLVIGGSDSKGKKDNLGFGLALDQELLNGWSSPCRTFDSPSLSELHPFSSFKIRNLEVWALTPSLSLKDAERNQQERQWLLSGKVSSRDSI